MTSKNKKILIMLFFFSLPLMTFADNFSLSPPGFAEGKTPEFLTLLGWILRAAFFTVSILAVLMIIVGGVQYILAGSTGNPDKIGDAQDRIKMSIFGILLALSSWLILNTINPDLLKLELDIPGLGNNKNNNDINKPPMPTFAVCKTITIDNNEKEHCSATNVSDCSPQTSCKTEENGPTKLCRVYESKEAANTAIQDCNKSN